jgi:hypothetical protein
MPDLLRAADLADAHVGRRVRVGGHEGILRSVYVDDEFVQLLLVVPGASPLVPIVGAGAPVDLLD